MPLMSSWAYFFWLIIVFLGLLWLNRWIVAHVHGVGYLLSQNKAAATWAYFFLFLPGILVHELSHFLMAVLLRVKTGRLSLWPQPKGHGQVVMGSVEVQGADPLRHSLIGLAPLLVGTLVVLGLARLLRLDQLGAAFVLADFAALLEALNTSLATPDFWLWLYLLFVVVNTMLPSPADRLYWTPVLVFFSSLVVILVGLDLLPAIPNLTIVMETEAPPWLAGLTSGLLTALAVNVFFCTFIILAESLISVTTGRSIRYN